MTEHEQKTLNPFGEALVAIMTEKGIADVPELVERMRQQPDWHEGIDEELLAAVMTAVYPDHWPEEYDMRLTLALKDALGISTEEAMRLVFLSMDTIGERPREQWRAICTRARQLDPGNLGLWNKYRERESLGVALEILYRHGETADDAVRRMRQRAQEGGSA